MESRIQHLFLAFCLLVVAPSVLAADKPEQLELEPLMVREPERRLVKVDRIDSENFEIGVGAGLMSVEDFGTNPTADLRFAYHVTEGFFIEGQYGRTRLGETSFERLSGGAQLLTDDERKMRYYNVSVGYNLFPGESFIGKGWTFKGGLYLIGGVGSTDVAGAERFTINAGLGYRLVATDWLAFHLTVRDHIVDSDLLGSKTTYHNIAITGGLSVFF